MRDELSRSLVERALADERVLLLTGDHGYSLFDEFRRQLPDRYINAGVAEQNMVGVAAGLAKAGFRPIVYGLSAFVPIRVLEQIKIDVCYEGLPVLFLGDGAGVVYGPLGVSHHCTEDLAALRALPGINLLSPADGIELKACMQLAATLDAPTYLRIGKADLGAVHQSTVILKPGTMLRVRKGKSRTGGLAWIATGSMVTTVLQVADRFAGGETWSAPCVKPIDDDCVVDVCHRHSAVIVAEEHSVFGGLGSAVTEISAQHAPVRVLRIGVEDRFATKCGSYQYLCDELGLGAADVERRVRDFLSAIPDHELRDCA